MRHVRDEAGHALEQRAALQYLCCGRLEQGRPLLAKTLRRCGSGLPLGSAGSIATLVYERARLKLRGLEFRERPADPATRQQRDLLSEGGVALAGLDYVGGAILAARHLRLALDAGDAEHVAFALLMEAWHRSMGVGSVDLVSGLLQRVEAMCASSE